MVTGLRELQLLGVTSMVDFELAGSLLSIGATRARRKKDARLNLLC